MNSYVGYLKNGVKYGLGIEVSRKGRIIQQGIWKQKLLTKNMNVNTLLVNCTDEQITQCERESEDDFLPYAGTQQSYRLRIGNGFNLLDDFDDDLDVRNDDEYNMEMQPD